MPSAGAYASAFWYASRVDGPSANVAGANRVQAKPVSSAASFHSTRNSPFASGAAPTASQPGFARWNGGSSTT